MKFNIADSIDYFRTGHLMDGRAVLLIYVHPSLHTLYFDPDGVYVDSDHITLNIDPLDEEVHKFMSNRLRALGARPGVISIAQFRDDHIGISIDLLPEHLREFERDPSRESHERQKALRQDLAQWRRDRLFVLTIDDEYFMSADGEVEST